MKISPYNYEATRLRDIKDPHRNQTSYRNKFVSTFSQHRTSYYCRFESTLNLYNEIIRRVGRIFVSCTIRNNSRRAETLVGTFNMGLFLKQN